MAQYIEAEATEEVTQRTKYVTKDRQWDARFNSPSSDRDGEFINKARELQQSGRLRYVLLGGPEIGTNPNQDDYGCRHFHAAFVFNNPLSRTAILAMFGVKKGYYLMPRKRSLPISGWREHHVKLLSKIDQDCTILFEAGELPEDTKVPYQLRSAEEKKRKVDEVIVEIHECLKRQETEDEIFHKFPRNWMMYGEKIKSMMSQRKDFFKANGDPHLWVHGSAGCGKSSLIAWVYPDAYKKNLYNRFFDLYNPKDNQHVLLEDLDHNAVETLSLNFIKTLCDESGFSYDQKYKAPQPARTTVIVTSQFDISNILAHLEKQIEVGEQGRALRRRFFEVRANELHRLLGVKMRNKYELNILRSEGNSEPSACFMAWNYLEDMPSIHPLPTAEECREKIKQAYYKM